MDDAPTLKRIPVGELRAGMFVVAIYASKGRVAMSQSGLVKSQEQVHDMARRGVTEVDVDPARSQQPDQPAASRPTRTAKDPGTQIRNLYGQARDLQEKLLNQVRAGEAIDVEPLEEIAEEMVDTLFSHGDAMLCLARIRAKDAYLMEHSMNVAILLANFGRHLGMERQVLKELTMGGLLHDVGKVMTPDEILHKPGRLTDSEFDVMREHAMHSRLIMRATGGITDIMVDVAANHHERMDGTGYPRGLRAGDLSVHSRMSSIVDVYDALTADRVYKQGMPCTQAFRILLEGAGSHFDRELVAQFIQCMSVYPPGAVVRLSNQRLAIVMQRNRKEPLKPLVKIFYHAARRHYEEVRLLDLAKPHVSETIVESVDHTEYGIRLEEFL